MDSAELAVALRERRHRVTAQRVVIHEVLHELGTHATAETVLGAVSGRLPGIALPTVYATLDLLEELGAVRRVAIPGGPALFDPRVDPHHHLVCRSCGSTYDLDAAVARAPALRAAGGEGFDVRHAEVVVSGLCRTCAA